MMIFVFSLSHQVLGNRVSNQNTRFAEINSSIWVYFLNTWVISTGGENHVDAGVWFTLAKEDASASPQVMNVLNWVNMLMNKILVKQILIMFLIGLIMRSFNT